MHVVPLPGGKSSSTEKMQKTTTGENVTQWGGSKQLVERWNKNELCIIRMFYMKGVRGHEWYLSHLFCLSLK